MPFIAFEGLDGTGKSSLMTALETLLQARAVTYVRTREPGGSPLGDDIRDLLLRKVPGKVPTPRTELLLYEAGRAQHVDELIEPSLAAGKWVLSDRFASSSVAFQAGGREISLEQVQWLNSFATHGLQPDLNVLLDLDVQESRRRRQGRGLAGGESEDRMESEADAFHERVRSAFLKIAKENPQRWLVLDARQSTSSMMEKLLSYLKEKKWLD